MAYQGFSEAFLKAMIADALNKAQPGQWNITRHFMYTRLSSMLQRYNSPDKQCLSISHSAFLAKILGLQDVQITEANYPEHNMLNLRFGDETFDFCLSDQVLEHIEGNPFAAFEEALRVTKKGGFIAHTTCFMNEIHGFPKDFWRFTPDALRLMAEQCGAYVVDCGGWGNKDVWSYMALGFRMAKIPSDPSHPICQMAMVNDDSIPIVTWVVAQK